MFKVGKKTYRTVFGREEQEYVREITCADTTVCEERGAGGAPGVRDSPAGCGEDQAEAAVPL